MRLTLAVTTLIAASVVAALAQEQAPAPSLDIVLSRAAAYVREFKRELSGMVAEERYVQDVRYVNSVQTRGLPRHRELRSDFLLVQVDGDVDGYEEFRDVYEVDGEPVRDREERLTRLFMDPRASSAQLQEIRAESARYNIGRLRRNINTPTLALLFLNPAHRSRFRFTRATDRRPRLEHRDAQPRDASAPAFTSRTEFWVIEYRETLRPTLIRTADGRDMPSRGRFWIDPETGQLLMTELLIDERGVLTVIDVLYEVMPFSSYPVPVEMRERYEQASMTLMGTATYTNFRKFGVDVSQTIGDPLR